MKITAEIQTLGFGPAVVVTVEGERLPWQFPVRAAAVRTPMRRRATIARAVEFVGSRLAAQLAPAAQLGKAA